MRGRAWAFALSAIVLLAPHAAAVTFGSVSTSASTGASTSRTVSAPAGTLAGHFLLAQVVTSDGDGVTITAPSGWSLVGRTDNGGHVGMAVYSKVATSAEPASYTWSFSKNTKSAIGVSRYVDVLTSSPLDGTPTSALTSGTSLTLPSVTTSTANARLVAFVASATATSVTPASGMSERFDVSGTVTAESADVVLATAGASGAKTFTAAASGRMVGGMLALKKAPTPTVSLDRASSAAWESNGTVRFWANLSLATQLPVSVAYVVSGSATGGGVDHALASGTLSFAAGQTSKGINATILNDATAEPNETVTIAFTTLANVTAGAVTSATHTIVNDDTTVGFTATASSLAEGAGPHAIAVTLGMPTPREVALTYTSAAGTATAGSDYTAVSGTLTFPPWQTSRSISVPVTNDALDEADETLSLTLSAATNALLTPSSHAITIVDDDATPDLSLSSATLSVPEAGPGSVGIALSAASGRPVRVAYATAAGTATIPGDVAAASGSLTFLPGETTKSVSLAPVQDALDELDETFTLALSGAGNASIALGSTTIAIVDDDAPPTVRFASSGSSGSESAALPAVSVLLSAPSSLPVGVSVSVAGGSASAEDFTGGAATLAFAPGETSASVALAAVDDAVHEGDETVVLALSAPSNAALGTPSTHTLTITDDEAPITVRFSEPDASAAEASGGRAALAVLSGVAATPITVNYTWSGGTATLGEDFVAASGTLTFSPGQTSQAIPFTLVDDEAVEPDETIVLQLADPANATLASATHTFTILNDDVAYPTVSFSSAGVALAEGAASPSVTVVLSAAHPRLVTVDVGASGTATLVVDVAFAAGTLTFQPGEVIKVLQPTVVDDAAVEPDETLDLTLTNPSRATLGAVAAYTRTILNDDVAPPVAAFEAATSTVSETAASVALRVRLDRAATSAMSVSYAVTAGTATGEGIDYALPSGTLTFDPGESVEEIVVVLVDDIAVETPETVAVALSSPIGGTLGAVASHVLTITSDDVAPVSLSFAASSSAASEAAGDVQIVVLASTVAPETYEVSYAATGGTASATSDYALPAGTLVFEPGETSKVITISLANDADHELDETIVVSLLSPTYGALGSPATHVLTIQNDDAAPPTFAFAAAVSTVAESAGATAILVYLVPAAPAPSTVVYSVTGGTATQGVDYSLPTGTLTFAAGETSRSIQVQIIDDAAVEAGETVVIGLSSPSGALLGPSEHVLTIANDDSVLPSVQWALAASTASEGAGTATLTATLSSSATSPVSVSYSVTGGTATGAGPGLDHTLAAGTLTFPAGETTRSVQVTLVDDTAVEGDETVLVTLATPTGATLGSTLTHTLTILENDAAPTSLVEVIQTPVLADGSPHAGATWGGWSAEPGATNVGSVNYLKLVNTGTLSDPRVVIAFAPSGFVGRTDGAFAIPTQGNLQFAWWEDATPLSSSPSEGAFTFSAAGASPSVTLQFSGSGRVIYVAYRIVQMPGVLLDQPYDGSFTVTEL